MKTVFFATVLLLSSLGASGAKTLCDRGRQHASSTTELVALAAANGITVSREERAKISRCFKQRKRHHAS